LNTNTSPSLEGRCAPGDSNPNDIAEWASILYTPSD
jgi:hypothetical protein